MSDAEDKFWPFKRQTSLIAAALALPGLLLVAAGVATSQRWPTEASENTVLIGVLVLSLMPILLSLLDVIIERGATVGYGDFKIDFSQAGRIGTTGITVSSNIGIRGRAVYDHDTFQIVDALKQAVTSEVVIIDLEDGQAWWETRLLVLLAGADRLNRPERVVFVARESGTDQRFHGWAYARDLLPRLAKAHPHYEWSLQATRTAARQWELVEPLAPGAVAGSTLPPSVVGVLATRHPDWAFTSSGLRNELLAEQLLQDDLGLAVEAQGGPRSVHPESLDELFCPVLKKKHVDLAWSAARQTQAILEIETPYVALTEGGRYTRLVPRLTLIAEALKPIIRGRKTG